MVMVPPPPPRPPPPPPPWLWAMYTARYIASTNHPPQGGLGGRLPLGHHEVPYVLADGRLQLSLSVGVPRNDLRKCLPPTPPFLNPIGAVGVATGALLPLLPAPLSLCPYLLPLLFLIPSMVYRQKKDHNASQKGRLSRSDHVGRKRTRLLEHVLLMRDFQRYFQPIFNPISAPYVFEDFHA